MLCKCTILLQSETDYAIIGLWNQSRKEWNYDRHERTIFDPRASWRNFTNIARYRHAASKRKEAKRHQDQRSMACKGERSGEIPRGKQQHLDTRRQKIKPPRWLVIVKDFTAVSLPLTDWNPRRDKPWCTLPTFSIHGSLSYDKVWYTGMGTR